MNLVEIDLSDIEFWAKPWAERNAAFGTHHSENPNAHSTQRGSSHTAPRKPDRVFP